MRGAVICNCVRALCLWGPTKKFETYDKENFCNWCSDLMYLISSNVVYLRVELILCMILYIYLPNSACFFNIFLNAPVLSRKDLSFCLHMKNIYNFIKKHIWQIFHLKHTGTFRLSTAFSCGSKNAQYLNRVPWNILQIF